MSKVTLTDINSGYQLKEAYNANNDKLKDALDNTLSRDGTTPNHMEAQLDMNSNRVINVEDGVAALDAVNLRQLTGTVFSEFALGSALVVKTYVALSAIPSPTDGDVAVVDAAGIHGLFVYDSTQSAVDNGGTIIDGWVRRFDGTVMSSWFGTVGDGVADDTLAFQAGLDVAIAGGYDYRFIPGVYKVAKNSALPGFPGGDHPCLVVSGATDMTILGHGASLKVDEHAQGILEIQLSTNVVVDGLVLEGAGNFPPLDGVTGVAEKGSASGWNTVNFWGYYKNNSSNTVANNTGGFGGNFPQWGGGTAATWGLWNGGFIGNVAYGLLVHNNCKDITIKDVEAEGFNYAGIGVGHNGDYFPVDRTYPDSVDVKLDNCHTHDMYSAGIHAMAVDGFTVNETCVSEDIGHPDAVPVSDTVADPGYGITLRSTAYSVAKNVLINGATVRNCVRKGIDSHASDRLTITGNRVTNCAASGIYAVWSGDSVSVVKTIITGNHIENCNYGSNNLGALYVNGVMGSTGTYTYARALVDAVVNSNVLINCGGIVQLRAQVARNLSVCNNIVRGVDARYVSPSYAIWAGRVNEPSYHVICSNNIVDADGNANMTRGITMHTTDLSQCNHNIVTLDHASAQEGLTSTACLRTDFFGNRVYVDPGAVASVPLNVSATDGISVYNYSDPDVGSLSYPIAAGTTAGVKNDPYRVPHMIQLDITFNGTAAPAYTVLSGEDYIDTVEELAVHGVRVGLKNVQPTASLRSVWTHKSASGLTRSGGTVDYIYERGINENELLLGLKVTAAGALLIASQVTTGTLSVTIFVT